MITMAIRVATVAATIGCAGPAFGHGHGGGGGHGSSGGHACAATGHAGNSAGHAVEGNGAGSHGGGGYRINPIGSTPRAGQSNGSSLQMPERASMTYLGTGADRPPGGYGISTRRHGTDSTLTSIRAGSSGPVQTIQAYDLGDGFLYDRYYDPSTMIYTYRKRLR